MPNEVQVNLLSETEQKNLLSTKIDLQLLDDFFIINFKDFTLNNQEYILKKWSSYLLETKDKILANNTLAKIKKNNIDFNRFIAHYSESELFIFKRKYLKRMSNFDRNEKNKNTLVKAFIKRILNIYNDNEPLTKYFIENILYQSSDLSLANLLAFYDDEFKKSNKKGSSYLIVKHIVWDISSLYNMLDVYNDDVYKNHLNRNIVKFQNKFLYMELNKYSRYYRNNFSDLSSFMAAYIDFIDDKDYKKYMKYFQKSALTASNINFNSEKLSFVKDKTILNGLIMYHKLH
jgi:hypothetical protein